MSRGPLTRSCIADTALALIEEQGLEKLSMRRLGAALGVEAMSLYNHVKNKSDLLDAVHERVLSDLEVPRVDDWRQAIRLTSKAFLERLRSHPGCIPLIATRSATTPGSLQVLDACVTLLMRAGFSPADSLMAFQSVFSLVLGHAIFHYARRDPDSFADPAVYEVYPALSQIASCLDYRPEQELQFALDVVIAGLEACLEAGGPDPPPTSLRR